ncbi:SUKH-4 family immunity protein [Streptomyces sp. NPDC048370]|uniref:SUKH-4 family immunity protein n=1 Tax=Streptomyces sp. NPDC048370 TaxID=3365540 RepID=UPI00371FE53F
MATYGQLTEWAGPGHVSRARRDVVAGWRIPGVMKAQLVEVGIPVAPRLIERVVMQIDGDPVLLTSRGRFYRLTEQADPNDPAERSEPAGRGAEGGRSTLRPSGATRGFSGHGCWTDGSTDLGPAEPRPVCLERAGAPGQP